MSIFTCTAPRRHRWPLAMIVLAPALMAAGIAPALADDAGKKACMPDAKRLCSHEMHSLSRSKVRACLIVHMAETSPPCHDFMVKARNEALSGRKPDASAL
ncbi:hypothetical protein [Novosphingobium sp.]|uniref:hypothetical protein n=1 Tax=Novosphingobium sp. TaxID=1874826 RepID=UPI003341D57B